MRSRFQARDPRRAVLLGALLAVLSGCQSTAPTAGQSRAVPYPFTDPPTVTGSEPGALASNSISPVETGLAVPVQDLGNSIDLLPAPAVSEWVLWETWSMAHGLGRPRKITAGAEPVFEARSTNGSITITAGNQAARVNGIECWLGYYPRLRGGQPYLHVLDAQKTLKPLLARVAHPFQQSPVIVIDPGHGGSDAGSRNITNNRFEKEYTLDWAFRLGQLLAHQGWTVYMTRTNDVEVSLPDRVLLAERVKADLFLSLHFNSAFPRTEHAGMETYCLTPQGMPSTLRREFADDSSLSYPNNAYDEPNIQVAARLHRSLLQTTGAVDRGLRRARFMGVLRTQNRPAVLLEGGYLSNPPEAAQISRPEYRQRLAQAIARALTAASTEPELAGQTTPPGDRN